jgi:Right handed beta helix region
MLLIVSSVKGTGSSIKLFYLASIFVASAHAAEYHVSTTGANGAAGTAAAPWRTIQRAANAVVAGDTVLIHTGTYNERVTLENRAGSALAPITFQNAPGESAVLSQLGVTPPDGLNAVLSIRNCDYITVQGIAVRDYETTSKAKVPVGILISGSGSGLKLLGCSVTHIWQSFTGLGDFGANAHGIAVFGEAMRPITGLVIDGCEVSDLRLGASESVVLNGNVTNFEVTNNRVHDSNNIGIDFIGFEGVNPNRKLDQAKFGRCAGNVVWNIDTKYNPVYGGNFGTGGNASTQVAPGIYVDGGSDILIERNHVFSCNFGLSVGSEQPGRLAARIKVRNNIFHHNHVGGVIIGGEDTANSGGASACSFTNNTIWENDLAGAGGGQVLVQYSVRGTSIQRNIIGGTATFFQLIVKSNKSGRFAPNAINWNLYYAPTESDIEFIWNKAATTSFTKWKPSGRTMKDRDSRLINSPVGFVNPAPTPLSPATDFRLTADSPALDSGDSKRSRFFPAATERDYFGGERVANGRVDIGAHERQ